MTNNKQSPIYIIGDTALAYTLAAKLTLAEEKVYLIAGKDNILFSSSVLLREDNLLQKKRVQIQTTTAMHENAKMVILAIHPNTQKTLMTYFSPSKASDCPIISFCHTSSPEKFNILSRTNPVPAYFEGYTSFIQENTLIAHNTRAEIMLSTNEQNPHFDTIHNILSKTYFKVNFCSNDIQNFWKHFAPYAACSLFSCEYGNNLKETTKNPELRQFLTLLIDEILSVAPFESQLEKEQIITSSYSTPKNYTFPLIEDIKKSRSGELMFIQNILLQQPASRTTPMPTITKIINRTIKQILSSKTE